MVKQHKSELLAPAGSKEGFYGAICAGADAVYLAGKEYGARAYADNFSEEELLTCIRYAHLMNRKVYLTVNTLVKESELERLPSFLAPIVDAGLDGVIVQDFGVFYTIRECFPKLPLHVSTQMTVTGAWGAKFLAQMGASRIVPARELSLSEIMELKKESGLEVECFIHGAMCYCYSGQCLFSSVLGGRSGNRGRCAQPCRLPYRVKAGQQFGKEAYPLSLKDMCTLEMLPELLDAGIDSFKIEGRMKKPEYTAGVTAIYRKYIDYYRNNGQFHVSEADYRLLRNLYMRSDLQTGYYHKHNGREMITADSPSYAGSDEKLLTDIREKYLKAPLKQQVVMRGIFKTGEPAQVWMAPAHKPQHWVKAFGTEVQAAQKAPVGRESLEKQLGKLGDSWFSLVGNRQEEQSIEIEMDENIFIPLKEINELRRQAVKMLEEELLNETGK